ncbi:TPA: DUF6809 family protein [Clostridioides difficile]|nr:hypothetical protein [Clostridioides difficile]MDM9773579.1 hypothetical protein [Clostridioides difficile]HBF7477274.1 hypothetical protein [Clostridioides difficile]
MILNVRKLNNDITTLETRINNIYNCLNKTLNENQKKLLAEFDELQIELKQIEMFQSYKNGLIEGIKFI